MKIRTNVKAGKVTASDISITAAVSKSSPALNHNETILQANDDSAQSVKNVSRKLRLNKETIRELKVSDLKRIAGGEAASGLGCNIDAPFIRRTR